MEVFGALKSSLWIVYGPYKLLQLLSHSDLVEESHKDIHIVVKKKTSLFKVNLPSEAVWILKLVLHLTFPDLGLAWHTHSAAFISHNWQHTTLSTSTDFTPHLAGTSSPPLDSRLAGWHFPSVLWAALISLSTASHSDTGTTSPPPNPG